VPRVRPELRGKLGASGHRTGGPAPRATATSLLQFLEVGIGDRWRAVRRFGRRVGGGRDEVAVGEGPDVVLVGEYRAREPSTLRFARIASPANADTFVSG
jgi:hypothetical protein